MYNVHEFEIKYTKISWDFYILQTETKRIIRIWFVLIFDNSVRLMRSAHRDALIKAKIHWKIEKQFNV